MNEVVIGSRRYRIGKLHAVQQFHVMRRLAPMMAALGISIENLKSLMKEGSDLVETAVIPALGPMSQVLAEMSDKDVDYILATCLGVVQREQPEMSPVTWAIVSSGGRMMFDDLGMAEMIQLVIQVIRYNLGDFSKDLSAAAPTPRS